MYTDKRTQGMRERDIEKYLKDSVEKVGGVCWKWVSPGMRGVPDRVCVFPGGQTIFVEVKNETGELSALQKIVRDKLLNLGANWDCVASKDDVDALVYSWKINMIDQTHTTCDLETGRKDKW